MMTSGGTKRGRKNEEAGSSHWVGHIPSTLSARSVLRDNVGDVRESRM